MFDIDADAYAIFVVFVETDAEADSAEDANIIPSI